MKKIDRAEYEKRVARISEIFAGIVTQADKQSLTRCPYKNRFDQCTAQFGCRNKRKPRAPGELPACASDDKLNYRTAWETDPEAVVQARERIQSAASRGPRKESKSMANISYDGESCASESGRTIFDYADDLRVQVPTSCGRQGHCHECIVEIKRGMDALSSPSEAEAFLRGEFRLACQAVVERDDRDVEFAILRRTPKILRTGSRREVDLDPPVTRQGERVFYGDEPIDQFRGHLYGIAIDLGTTTIVADLLDLETGQSVYETAFENPQRFGGSDIMHRISYDDSEFAGELQRAVISALNTEIRRWCAGLGISRHEIYEVVVVGNSTMRDLFFGLDVQSIGQMPYKSITEHDYRAGNRNSTSLTEHARKLGIYANKNARVFGAPLIASHVGADTTANLVAIDVESQHDVFMLVDAGTNTEVVIGHRDRLIAASCPAGPAFEGGLVTYGMPGCEGAIESIRYVPDRDGLETSRSSGAPGGRFAFETIGNAAPQGICGSGLIDLLAVLRRHDLMSPKGVFANKATQFTIVPEQGITFSRNDASELAQAKAANYCGQIILMRKFGITPERIGALYLAGGFANYVDSVSAVEIGFLAPVPGERIHKVGNAAAQGAREMLLSRRKRTSIERLIRKIEHVELETMPDFFEVFVEGCQFKPMIAPTPRKGGSGE